MHAESQKNKSEKKSKYPENSADKGIRRNEKDRQGFDGSRQVSILQHRFPISK
jgi:hypothetical protein